MARLQNTTYSQNTTIQSAGTNVVRPPIVTSVNTGLADFNNLVYITNTNAAAPRAGDAIQVYYSSGAGCIKYVTYGP